MSSTSSKQTICVVGGGTAGWVTLAYLAASIDVNLILISTDTIDIIGVGESTTPTVKYVADAVGVSEFKWMKDANATFKYGIEYFNFHKKGSLWTHTFDDLIPGQCFSTSLTHFGKQLFTKDISSIEYFLTLRKQNSKYNISKYNDMHGSNQFLIKNRLSPFDADNNINIGLFPGYSYHINANLFGKSLKNSISKDRFREIDSVVTHVAYNEHGIKEILLSSGEIVHADVFIDCTGFHRKLISPLSEFKPYTDLLNNAAMAGEIKDTTIDRPTTECWAQDAGWIWSVPTRVHIGSGYVYCDKFITDEQAIDTITNFWKKRGKKWSFVKKINFTAGRLEHMSIKNVVSNGLSQSFLEPLEATSIMITCATVIQFARIFNKHGRWNDRCSAIHNKIMGALLENTKLFVKNHYSLSKRDDTDYWKTCRSCTAEQQVSEHIQKHFKTNWTNMGQTLLNQFNWASMLVGYEGKYTGDLPHLNDSQLANYLNYCKLIEMNYKTLSKNNVKIKQKLDEIHA